MRCSIKAHMMLTFDHNEEGSHSEHAAVREAFKGLILSENAGVPAQEHADEDHCLCCEQLGDEHCEHESDDCCHICLQEDDTTT
jgi:hypothetical protein